MTRYKFWESPKTHHNKKLMKVNDELILKTKYIKESLNIPFNYSCKDYDYYMHMKYKKDYFWDYDWGYFRIKNNNNQWLIAD